MIFATIYLWSNVGIYGKGQGVVEVSTARCCGTEQWEIRNEMPYQ